jgi:uncharacterized protein (DUF305 family)
VTPSRHRLRVLVASAAVAAACGQSAVPASTGAAPQAGPAVVHPGAPGQPSTSVKASGPPAYTDADVQFMQGMIHHHGQALDMAALIPTHSSRADMKILGEKITISQTDEIKMMQTWLKDRGKDAPDPAAMHHMMADGSMMGSMGPMMPGMLSPEEMKQLAAAKGPAFDTLFLQGMIKHHKGAITMVSDLFSHDGAAQDAVMFQFASDVRTDQQTEIHKMQQMLAAMQ